MLDRDAIANSIALTSGGVYIAFYFLLLVAPNVFEYVFNAQFFGADVANLVGDALTFGTFIGVLVTVVVTGWIIGYFWAGLYNHFRS